MTFNSLKCRGTTFDIKPIKLNQKIIEKGLEAHEIHSEQRSSRQDVHSIKRHVRQKSQRSFGIRYIVFLILALSLLLMILKSWTSILLTTHEGYWEPIHLHQNVWKTTSPLSQIMVTTCYYVQSPLRRQNNRSKVLTKGPDLIPAKYAKPVVEYITSLLTHIINECITQYTFPTAWK